MDSRRLQLLRQWRYMESEYERSEKIWKEKEVRWISEDQEMGVTSVPWREEEEELWLEEEVSSNRKLHEHLTAVESASGHGVHELQLDLLQSVCERRLHLQVRSTLWLQKEAWYTARQSSRTTILTLREQLRDVILLCEYYDRRLRIFTENRPESPAEAHSLKQQLLQKDHNLEALKIEQQELVDLMKKQVGVNNLPLEEETQQIHVGNQRDSLLKSAEAKCEEWYNDHPHLKFRWTGLILAYSLKTGELCTIEWHKRVKLRSFFLRLSRERLPLDYDSTLSPVAAEALKTFFKDKISTTKQVRGSDDTFVTTYCLETAEDCVIDDHCIRDFISGFFQWRQLYRADLTWTPLNHGKRIIHKTTFGEKVERFFRPENFKHKPKIRGNKGYFYKVEEAAVLGPSFFQWNLFLMNNPNKRIEYFDWTGQI
uniref:Uncharacterized protein n=1 Tax=Knipowitschia caucasica TaxID=637954 RepID=A0AAV2LQY8_KNICA